MRGWLVCAPLGLLCSVVGFARGKEGLAGHGTLSAKAVLLCTVGRTSWYFSTALYTALLVEVRGGGLRLGAPGVARSLSGSATARGEICGPCRDASSHPWQPCS